MTENNLKHIAIIMDGNGRWASKRGLPRNAGHQKGAEVVIEIAKSVKELGIQYLTIYAFSTENWKRSQQEVDGLMNLLRQYLDKNFEELEKNDVRICFIGERKMLEDDIVAKMENIEKRTISNKSLVLQVALSYGSRQEILHAVKAIAHQVRDNKLEISDINEQVLSQALYTANVPDPDLLIRTSGEQRISNYLLWQLAYTELFFTNTFWPDFNKEELKSIIANYHTRERRYGKA